MKTITTLLAMDTRKKIPCAVLKGSRVDIDTETKKKVFADYKGNHSFFCCADARWPLRRTHQVRQGTSHQNSDVDNPSLGLTFGRNIKLGEETTNAFGSEGTYYQKGTAYVARFERVEKDELVGVPPGTYTINKLAFGGVRNIASRHGFHAGVGAFDGLHSFPSSLEPLYGKSPVSLGVFIRVRPSKMKHDMGGMEPMK